MKYKICPRCKTKNPLQNQFCKCGYSLVDYKKITYSEEEGIDEKKICSEDVKKDEKIYKEFGIMRQCPECGKLLPYSIIHCDCGACMAGVLPYDVKQDKVESFDKQEKDIIYILQSEDGKYEIMLHNGDSKIIGREATGAEYLNSKEYVSRKHIQVEVMGNSVVLKHIGNTNPTIVNGKEIRKDEPFSIDSGDLIALGARPGQDYHAKVAYFRLVRYKGQEES